jgi:hypothetical protein
VTAALATRIYPQETYGFSEPIAQAGPLRRGAGKWTDGVFLEEGTTNLITNPSFGIDTTGWTSQGSFTIARSTARAFLGAASLAVTSTAGTNGGAAIGVPMTSGQTYALTAHVFIPSGTKPGMSVQILDASGQPLTADASLPLLTTTKGRWVRVGGTYLAASTGTLTFYTHTSAVPNTGDIFYVDAVQAENKNYVTSYADGSLATAWDAPGNLLPVAGQGFEDSSLGGMSVAAGTATPTNSAAQVYAGTRSLLLTVGATASLSVASATGVAGVPVVAGRVYTASLWVRPSAARQLRADILWYTAAGAFISSSAGTASTGVVTTWTRHTLTAIAPATAAFAAIQFTSTDATNADTIYLDGLRLAEGSGASSYRWTGAEWASTSTRTADRLLYGVNGADGVVQSNVTVCCWVRVAHHLNLPIMPAQISNVAGDQYVGILINGAAVLARKSISGVNVDASTGVSVARGDLVFVAATFDGANLIGYVSKNGAAVVSASTASVTVPARAYYVAPGMQTVGSLIADEDVEQVLVYAAALSSTDIATLAFSGPLGIEEDPRIVFAWRGRDPEGATSNFQAASLLGTLTPSRRPRAGATQNMPATVVGSAGLFGSALLVTVPDVGGVPSGVGVGESIILDDGAAHAVVQVARAGSADLLYVT